MNQLPTTTVELYETIAQQNRLISSQQLTMHEYQRQIADLNARLKEAVESNKDLEDKLANRVES